MQHIIAFSCKAELYVSGQ